METLSFRTERKTQLLDVTELVREAVEGKEGSAVLLFVPHTTAGIAVQASGSGAGKVASDIELALERIVGEDWGYQHLDEGDANPWAHVRAALTTSSLTIPLENRRLGLSDLQAIFFCEFDGPRERTLLAAVI